MNKKILSGFVLVLGVVILVAWEGNGMKKEVEADNAQTNDEKLIIEQIYEVETEQEMVQVEHTKTTEEEEIIYELTEEEERLGIKY